MDREIPELTTALSDADPARRREAAEKLSRLADGAKSAAVPLVQHCADPDEEVREWVVAALEELGPPEPSDLSELAALLEAPEPDLGYWAATLLGRLGPDAAPAVHALANAVAENPSTPVQQRAAWALGKIGPAAAPVLDSLQKAAESDDTRLSRLARQAIDAIGE